jgi:hypothetical protein
MVSTYVVACITGGLSTALAVVLTALLISQHAAYPSPRASLTIRIVLMVPVFAVVSFIGLLEIEGSETLGTVLEGIKEVYEAYVIHCFLLLMFDLTGIVYNPPKAIVLPDSIKGRHVHHSFPFNIFMKDMVMDSALLNTLTSWTMQFVYVRPILAIVEVALELFDAYNGFAHTLFSIILNVSISVAMYSLISFFHAFYKELEPHRPLAKFLVIKGVVFFAFWQGIVLELLTHFGIVHQSHWYTVQELSTAIQNFLVCIEMGLLFAFAQRSAFPVSKVSAGGKAKTTEMTPNSGHLQ